MNLHASSKISTQAIKDLREWGCSLVVGQGSAPRKAAQTGTAVFHGALQCGWTLSRHHPLPAPPTALVWVSSWAPTHPQGRAPTIIVSHAPRHYFAWSTGLWLHLYSLVVPSLILISNKDTRIWAVSRNIFRFQLLPSFQMLLTAGDPHQNHKDEHRLLAWSTSPC